MGRCFFWSEWMCVVKLPLLLVLTTSLYAQDDLITIPNKSTIDGTYSMASDSYGYTWIGTRDGLYRFNGREYEETDELLHSQIPTGDAIIGLFADSHGYLWCFLFDHGLFRINTKSYAVQAYPQFIGTTNGGFRVLVYEDPDGIVYLPYSQGLAKFIPGEDKIEFSQPKWEFSNETHALICGRDDGQIIVGTKDRAGRYDRESEKVIPILFPNINHTNLKCMGFDAAGHLWMSNWYNRELGLIRYDIDADTIIQFFGEAHGGNAYMENTDMWAVLPTENGIYFPSNDAGLWYFDLNSELMHPVLRREPGQKPSRYPQIISGHIDPFNRLWIGGTVFLYRTDPSRSRITPYRNNSFDPHSLKSNRTHTVEVLSDGRVAIGTVEGLSIFNPETEQFLNVELPNYNGNTYNNNIISLVQIKPGKLWVGSWSTLTQINLSNLSIEQEYITYINAGRDHDPSRLRLAAGALSELEADGEGNLWAINNHGQIVRITGPDANLSFSVYHGPSRDQGSVEFNGLAISDKCGLLASSNQGVWQWQSDTIWMPWPNQNAEFKQSIISDISIASTSHIYISTPTEAWKANSCGESFHAIPCNPKLLYRNLNSPLEDLNGNLWLWHDEGLLWYDQKRAETVNFGAEDHLYNGKAFAALNARRLALHPNGEIFCATANGLITIDPNELSYNPKGTQVNLNQLRVNNEPYLPAAAHSLTKLELAHNQNNLSLSFSATYDPYPSQVRYQYRLGLDAETWIDMGFEPSLALTGLAPGRYKCQVRSISSAGVISKEIAQLDVQIRNPWYQTWWAYIGYSVILCTIIFVLYQLRLRAQLSTQKAEQLAELTQFKNRLYTNITHEFRTPLTVISGMADLIKEDEKAPELIKRNANNLLDLVNQMLDLQKLELGHLKLDLVQGDIVPFVAYVTESFRSLGELKNQQFHFLEDPRSLVADFDPNKLARVLSNLLSNAIKFTPEHGNIYLQLSKSADDQEIILRLRDTGIGIPTDKLSDIFKRFYQVDDSTTRAGEGTGIGLTIVSEYVKLMQGNIEVQSSPGLGTTFEIRLPISNDAPLGDPLRDISSISANASSVQHSRQASVNGSLLNYPSVGPSVLIVEDNPDVIHYVGNSLKDHYQVTIAMNGEEGIHKALDMVPDLIVSDVMMPIKDGFELCGQLKNDARTSHIPIILLTAKADTESRITGLKRGADVYLEKPFHKEELLVQMNNLLHVRKQLQERYNTMEPLVATDDPNINIEDIFIKRLHAVLEENLSDETFDISALCTTLKISRSQLHNKLKALTGLSTSHYIRQFRLAEAKKLLKENTELNISEVAFEVGFKDPKYFSKLFKDKFGMSPSEFNSK